MIHFHNFYYFLSPIFLQALFYDYENFWAFYYENVGSYFFKGCLKLYSSVEQVIAIPNSFSKQEHDMIIFKRN